MCQCWAIICLPAENCMMSWERAKQKQYVPSLCWILPSEHGERERERATAELRALHTALQMKYCLQSAPIPSPTLENARSMISVHEINFLLLVGRGRGTAGWMHHGREDQKTEVKADSFHFHGRQWQCNRLCCMGFILVTQHEPSYDHDYTWESLLEKGETKPSYWWKSEE